MANEKCGDPIGTPEPVPAGTRIVHCVKFGAEKPGLDRVPWKGPLGQRIYDNVSKEAWKLWLAHATMVVNEYRLNPLDPQSQEVIESEMERFFFGAGAQIPAGYVPPLSKG